VYYPIFAATVPGPGGPGGGPEDHSIESFAESFAQKKVSILVAVRNILPDATARENFIKQTVSGGGSSFSALSSGEKENFLRAALASKVLSSLGGKEIAGTDRMEEGNVISFLKSNYLADGGLIAQYQFSSAGAGDYISSEYAGAGGYFNSLLAEQLKIINNIGDVKLVAETPTGSLDSRIANYTQWFNKTYGGPYLDPGDKSLYLYASQLSNDVMDIEARTAALAANPNAVVATEVGVNYLPTFFGAATGALDQGDNSTVMLNADQLQIASDQFKALYASQGTKPQINVTSAAAAQKAAIEELKKTQDAVAAVKKLATSLMPNATTEQAQKLIDYISNLRTITPILLYTDPQNIVDIFSGTGVNNPSDLSVKPMLYALRAGAAAVKAPTDQDLLFNQLQTPSLLGVSSVIQDLIQMRLNGEISDANLKKAMAILAANNPQEAVMIQKLIDADPSFTGGETPTITRLRNDGLFHPIFNWADMSSSTSLSIDQLTGNAVFTAQILNSKGGLAGYIKFDPVTKLYDAQLSVDYAGKSVQFFSDPRNQDVYVTVSSDKKTTLANGMVVPAALANLGPLELMSASISSSGSVGGTFRYQNRVFSYNPNSQAFEIPIAIYSNGTVRPFSMGESLVVKNKDGTSKTITGKGIISIDTKGNLTGSYELLNQTDSKGVNQAGNLYFDRSGNIGFVYTASQTTIFQGNATTRSIGSIAFDIKGNVNGTVNLGKALNFKSDVLLGFDKNGLTGLGWSTGFSLLGSNAGSYAKIAAEARLAYEAAVSQAGSAVGIGSAASSAKTVADAAATASSTAAQAAQQQLLKTLTTVTPWIDLKSGAFSLNTPVLSLGQINGKGDIGFKWPGGSLKLCSIGITKCESRPDVPTVPIADADGNVDFSAVQCQHSYKQLFQTVKIYNDAKVEGAEAQAARSALIFKSFNDILGRNPGQAEYIDWYFIMDNQRGTGGYTDWQCNEIELLKINIEKTLKATKEAQCLASSGGASATATATTARDAKKTTKASDCPAPPADLMPSDPLNQTSTTTTTTETASDTSNVVDEFLNGVNEAAAEDPLWNGSSYTNAEGDMSKAQISLTKGYNAFFVPSNMTSVDASVLDIDKYVLFEFNGDGTKKWYSSERSDLPKYLQPGTGYYVYSRSDNVKVPLKEVSGAKTGVQVHQGWNLLANDTDQAAKLSELVYSVVKTAACKTTDCTESKSLRNLYSSGRAYSKIYVVSNDKETDAAKAFQVLTVDANNADSITIPTGKIFWFYLK